MYAASTSSTTSGSGAATATRGAAGAERERRVRVVRLLRPRRAAPAFGFSLRGGREYSTGFFISKVELNSEAHHQGLKVGDQLMSVNGYRVDDAVHSELAHYLATQTRLKIKVRNVGMIPIKEKAHEPLSWQFVSDHASISSGASASPTLCHDTQRLQHLRLSILVPPRAKLGCGICKGPEWKPGIFVQFVRENGIAREAGLRPGDQILACNGQDFSNISFNDAILAMKATGRLEIVVREGAGLELVSPESSGYNSSASSAAGERSPAPSAAHAPHASLAPLAPPAALRRRLASVAEEAAVRVDRLTMNRIKRRTWDSLDFDWKNIHNFDAPSDIEPDYDSPSIPNNPHSLDNQIKDLRKKDHVSSPSNRTIINLTENGATIQCSYENQSPSKASYSTSQQQSSREIVVEVHHGSCTQSSTQRSNRTAATCTGHDFSDTSSVSSSLSSAIAEEILKRKLKKKEKEKTFKNDENVPAITVPKKSAVTKTMQNEKQKQHDALMDEFKKVHRKMFSNQEVLDLENNIDSLSKDDWDTLSPADVDRESTLPLRKAVTTSNGVNKAEKPPLMKEINDSPPPPPPMPMTNGAAINGSNKPTKSNPRNTDLADFNHKNGTLKRIPTPDYNNKITTSSTPTTLKSQKTSKNEAAAELESLQSYKLNNPSLVQPKPPSTYFVSAPNGTATMKKHVRPVSVTIGEYPSSGGGRKEPNKLEFLASEKPNGVDGTDDASISNRLQSELALTLSRSNLRKKTDSIDNKNIVTSERQDNIVNSYESLDKNFHLRYGHNILPLPPTISIPKIADASR